MAARAHAVNEKERLVKTLRGQAVDRPPVICPGGMMNAAVTEVVETIAGNHNVETHAMIDAAKRVRELTGFENYGVPFCMTAEAEPLGIQVDLGNKLVEPRVTDYTTCALDEIMGRGPVQVDRQDRMQAVIGAIRALKNDEVPVIGNITGPISTASSAVDPNDFFKGMLKRPEETHAFLTYINAYLIEYAVQMIQAGADVIAISDPTATGEILGNRLFRKFALPVYQAFVEAIKPYDAPLVFHMCGKATNVVETLNEAGFHALSFDSLVNMRQTKDKITSRLMGNVNTQTLNFEAADKVETLTRVCLESGVDIVAPACGLGMSTPLANIRAMTSYVKSQGNK